MNGIQTFFGALQRSTVRAILVCPAILTGTAHAQTAALPKYKVVNVSDPQKAIGAINSAADQGYRILLADGLAVLRLDAAPPDTYRYLAVPQDRLLNASLNFLNQQGALGYGWLKGTQFLQKEPHPRNYAYTLITGMKEKTREASIEAIRADGFEEVGAIGNQTVFIRDIDMPKPSPDSLPTRLVRDRNAALLLQQVSRLGEQGYRYLGPALQKEFGASMLMQECSFACEGPFDYRSFESLDPDQLEETLNRFAQDRFRLVPSSIPSGVVLVERPAARAGWYSYRVIEIRNAAAAEVLLNSSEFDGYSPVAFARFIGWSVHTYVVLEMPSAAPK